ncbi:CPBP family intramembrane glutamic endopeptidase [Ruminococcus flavefaciens]|uniref:CPBP family intramembrane glutamic endopeptidase n=1 Tax=Ruminococcus flavefaciens TaxID=1265 RepID=UPI0026F12587|nr:CPBP family intramembrane glutamic endopeptidase [Ruminococcus flavefaciens]MDD7515117.1 CPBP family intramembrane metalloprotease [Ruminococcus flavefaciens]MDY5692614.1 CPBP family intramembrane glutamic endopeptidase [Ruminococcus flavefaciens]
MRKFIKNISPFNNRTDMPAAMLVIKKLLAFILCFAAGTLLGNAVVIGAMIVGGKKFLQGETFTESTMELLGLYAMAGMIAASVLYWKIIEKRNLSEMGVTGHIGGLFVGALIGTVLLFVCVSAIMLTGSISFEGLSQDINTSMLLLMLGGYIIQSAAEEFLCRGLVLCSLKDRVPMPVAIAANTFVFTFNHWGNFIGSEPEYIFSGLLCLIIISCIFSFLTLKTKSIWTACGLHSMWNFCLSCILGLALSGEGASAALIDMKSVGKNLLNGGKYGIEASLVTGMVLAAASVLLWFSYKKDNKERQV